MKRCEFCEKDAVYVIDGVKLCKEDAKQHVVFRIDADWIQSMSIERIGVASMADVEVK